MKEIKRALTVNKTTITVCTLIAVIAVIVFSPESFASFDVDTKYDEAEANFRDWFNKGAGLALIIASFLWLKVGNIDYKYPAGIFGALIMVNSIAELVAWFGS
ncbi:hypothetical protein BSPWISOX_2965 [uncultured Gammaproteobacteria bacterium]|nr:hypothetical protein BSPWISOX_2965 [uncultured Gammaproteobacteria bacterium]